MQAAQGYPARLVVVVGVLVGLALGHGVQCTDGMIAALAVEHVASSGMAVGSAQDGAAPAAMAGVERHSPDDVTAADAAHQVTAVSVLPGAAAVSPLAGDGQFGSHGLCGGLAACLAFIVAAVAVIVGLRPPWLRIFAPALMSRRAAVIRAVHSRAPSLAELCLLRT